MKGQTQNIGSTDQTFTLELSFFEMHVLIRAMNAYAQTGYGQWNSGAPNIAHQTSAEAFDYELSDLFTKEPEETEIEPIFGDILANFGLIR